MNKSNEKSPQKPKRNIVKLLGRGAATAALAAVASVAPNVAPAQAEKGQTEKLRSYIPTRVLANQTKQSLRQQRDLEALNGILLFDSAYNNGGTEYSSPTSGGAVYPSSSNTSVGKAIEHPLVVFRGSPKDKFGHEDLTNGDYAFGAISRKTGDVKLITFNPDTMKLVPWSMENGPLVKNFIFQRDKGHLNFDEPLTSSDGRTKVHGGPLTDNISGPSWQVGLELSPKG